MDFLGSVGFDMNLSIFSFSFGGAFVPSQQKVYDRKTDVSPKPSMCLVFLTRSIECLDICVNIVAELNQVKEYDVILGVVGLDAVLRNTRMRKEPDCICKMSVVDSSLVRPYQYELDTTKLQMNQRRSPYFLA